MQLALSHDAHFSSLILRCSQPFGKGVLRYKTKEMKKINSKATSIEIAMIR